MRMSHGTFFNQIFRGHVSLTRDIIACNFTLIGTVVVVVVVVAVVVVVVVVVVFLIP